MKNSPQIDAPAQRPIPFSNSYARLDERFFTRVAPTPVAKPRLLKLNADLAEELGLDVEVLSGPEGAEIFAGNRIPDGAEPIAMAYAGHQFGGFSPQLGDGRAILLGEVIDRKGHRRDIHLKGSGPTPFSRRGDGRAAIGPVLREYIVSEAMHALGIPTSRALAAVATGEAVLRERPLPGGVIARVAASHIRIGTFQYFAARGDEDAVQRLADHVIARHYPDAAEAENPYLALLDGVMARQADLVARWLLVGFIHGVMNTDNMAVSGETIDYGPCAFMDAYHPATVFSSIDHAGRYAYANQPPIAAWNLTRFAETLLPLLGPDADAAGAAAQERLGAFGSQFEGIFNRGLRAKIGLEREEPEDIALMRDLLSLMAENAVDFTLFFRRLANCADDASADAPVRALFSEPAAFDAWAIRWRGRLAREGRSGGARSETMRAVNPAFIPRNHRVEAVIAAAVERDDYAPFHELVAVLARPYDDQPSFAHYAEPPEEHQKVLQTFCGT